MFPMFRFLTVPPALTLTSLACLALFLPGTAQAQLANEPIKFLPDIASLKLDERRLALGRQLFREPRLSKDNTVSCASCHPLDKGGADGLKTSVGIRGQAGPVNAPTVFNSSLNFRQFWDGRADSPESQIDSVVHNAKEFDSSWPEILGKLKQDAPLLQAFKQAYGDGLNEKNLKDAIATYERSLLTSSRFDRYLKGDLQAISNDERKGHQLFKNYGCVACHQGVNVGGNMFQKFGVMGDYFGQRKNLTEADLGRFNVTRREADRHVFKVPSLRNVALTAPYFHDASAATLEEAVDVMFRYQLGRLAAADDKKYIVMFLKSLSGENLESKK